jgi:hypothetical protein
MHFLGYDHRRGGLIWTRFLLVHDDSNPLYHGIHKLPIYDIVTHGILGVCPHALSMRHSWKLLVHQSVKARTSFLPIQTNEIIKAHTLQRTKHPGPV